MYKKEIIPMLENYEMCLGIKIMLTITIVGSNLSLFYEISWFLMDALEGRGAG